MASFFEKHHKQIVAFQQRLFSSRFFTFSVFLHVILVVTFGSTVLFNKYIEPPDFTGGSDGFVSGVEGVEEPPPQQEQITQPTFQVQANTMDTKIEAITTSAIGQTTFSIPQIVAPVAPTNVEALAKQVVPPTASMGDGLTKEIASGIKGFTGQWAKGGSGGHGSSLKQREFEFTAYLAKYSGGNWASTVQLEGSQIKYGSLPNLLYIIRKFSSDRIKATPQAEPLNLASDDIFKKNPPFILFNGHQDFKLSEAEVANLRKYLQLGGCIWGDSSVPGIRSRFDIAFRREMKRVVADVNKDFEPLPPDHALFVKGYHSDIKDVVPGMNYFKEPIYVLRMYGEIGVIYTANDYCDMWQFGLDNKWKFDHSRDAKGRWIAMNRSMWDERGVYFRNISEESVKKSYQFGMNIIVHLITRWEDKLRTVPTSL